ncbi:DUF1853 family protein [Vibrio genomosp. F10]|uniref:Type II citrate synthase n=1 Tax=Vibrio genomosp. F10 str. ZF-129 TaxID=1187848 RepID=A0A1E5BEX7_9VIBR|nr:DUF1853 family protein [Vibrio genomosp. F10]OEE34250.1 type II citrate synthase [Vibrio genomosp. F10 str. ZF-129]OEE94208.1 type II citrate synthase [Vibrio genomosp. F10 str. 9ZC157]OEF09243.1 type II citrate synthase [Vibrio genomosp. F10 str. 9ZB36]
MDSLHRFYQWVITAPSLFEPRPPLDNLPALPHHSLPLGETYSGNPRLGFLYQYLCERWFEHSDDHQIVMTEEQINVDGRTLGEIDFIIQDRSNHQFEHWEVAIKFYLLHGSHWYGPNSKDRLDIKLKRMIDHQLTMSQTASFKQKYPQISPISLHLLLQGRLYVNPFIDQDIPESCHGYALNASQIQGKWCYENQWHLIAEPLYPLEKYQWATGATKLGEPIDKPTDRFVHVQTSSGEFWFVVPNHWPNEPKPRS